MDRVQQRPPLHTAATSAHGGHLCTRRPAAVCKYKTCVTNFGKASKKSHSRTHGKPAVGNFMPVAHDRALDEAEVVGVTIRKNPRSRRQIAKQACRAERVPAPSPHAARHALRRTCQVDECFIDISNS